MKTLSLLLQRPATLTALAAAGFLSSAAATAAADAPAPSAAAPLPNKLAPTPIQSGGVPEPDVREVIIEDEAMRIDELRVRGVVKRVTVQTKSGKAPDYEIMLPDAGQDVSGAPGPQRGAAGQRVWRVLSF
jgi:hypothetical protein